MPRDRTARPHRAARLAALLLLMPLAAAPAGARGFRGVEWGASRAEVVASERKYQLHHNMEEEVAYWNFKWAGVEAGLVYAFEDDRLVSARYVSRHRTSDPREDLADYETFKGHLAEHFGPYIAEEWVWLDGRDTPGAKGTLADLTAGRAELVTRWELEGSKLKLLIAGRDGEIKTVRAVFEPLAAD